MEIRDIVNAEKSSERRGRWKAAKSVGTIHGTGIENRSLPEKGQIKRYVLTSAQNNTRVNDSVWESLTALARHYRAEILVGTFSYDQNQFRQMSVKRGTEKPFEKEMWYDKRIEPLIVDRRVKLADGLIWCGEMNILPTAVNPLAALETYTARKSSIFPHAKMAMRTIPAMQGEYAKLNFTTGTVTKRNYVQKRLGLIAEHHHVYGALLVEVNDEGRWWVRQLNADGKGRIQDLNVVADGERGVTTRNHVEAVTWGDLHATCADETVVVASMDMLDTLRPKFQFLHDVLEGNSITHHNANNPHARFQTWLRGLNRLDEELRRTVKVLERYKRPWAHLVVVDSNHDDAWIQRWLREYDYRKDPPNSELFLKAQAHLYSRIRAGAMPRDVNMLEWCLREVGYDSSARFLVADESFAICSRKIECGMHGHLGPNGRWGTPENLAKMGRKANTAHTHTAGIYNGLYVAGTSSKLRWDYNRGPSGWTHSHIVTYPNGKRSIITIYDGKWRA